MTAINFPDSPTVGDSFTAGGRTWQWTGVFWQAVISQAQSGDTTVDSGDIDGNVFISGGGPLTSTWDATFDGGTV